MAKSTRNLIEKVESGTQLLKSLELRASKLATYKSYGPPDLCYIIKEDKGSLFSKPLISGYFHFIYGADTSSFSTVVGYIWSIVKGSKIE